MGNLKRYELINHTANTAYKHLETNSLITANVRKRRKTYRYGRQLTMKKEAITNEERTSQSLSNIYTQQSLSILDEVPNRLPLRLTIKVNIVIVAVIRAV